MMDKLSITSSNILHKPRLSEVNEYKNDPSLDKQTNQLKSQNEQINNTIPKAEIEEATESVNKFLEISHTNVQFKLHEKLDRYYVTIVDSDTKEVIKEIPPKKLLDLHASMLEYVGILVDDKI